jgi:adenylate cyclase
VAREQRKLAAILAADVVGYSRLMGRDESGTLARLRKNRSEYFDPVLTKYGGRLVKLTGDGALVEFASAVDALSAAIEFQQAMAVANGDQPTDTALVFRIGLHLGDVIVENEDLYGDGVNVAARLEAEAPPGGVMVSGDMHNVTAGRLKATFEDLGQLSLKNIERPVQAYAVRWQAADWPVAAPEAVGGPVAKAAATPSPDAPLPLPDKPSIAVLPFQNMSGDPEQEYFVDGLVEDVITALSRFKSLFVIARNSSFAYKGKAVDVRQVGRELGVRYVLEGSVRKAGNRLRITGQLIDAGTGNHLWADRFDGELADVFEVQDRASEAVAGVIAPTIEHSEIQRARRSPVKSFDAYDLHLRALAQYYEMTEESFARSARLFEQALQLDPNYVPALLAGLRAVSMRSAQGWVPPRDVKQISLDYSERALRLEKDNAEVLANVARLRSFFFGANTESLDLARRATENNPNSASAWMHCGWVHVYDGQPEKAVGYFERAIRLSPRDPDNFETFAGLAGALIQLGRYDDAVEAGRRSVQQGPNFSPGWRMLTAALALGGRQAEVREAVVGLLKAEPLCSLSTFWARNAIHKDYARIAEGLRLAGLPE